MNCYAYEQRSEMTPLTCPTPRRIGGWSDSHIRPNAHFRRQLEFSRVRVEAGLLDMIMAEGGYGNEKFEDRVVSSPPFINRSPPTRSSNPLARDRQFVSENAEYPPVLSSLKSLSPLLSPSSCKSRGVQMKIGKKAAAVRIEGFDCLGGDRQNCNISSVA